MGCKFFNWSALYGGYSIDPRVCLHPENVTGGCPYIWMEECPKAEKPNVLKTKAET